MKLLGRDIVIYPEKNGKIDKGLLYSESTENADDSLFTAKEREAHYLGHRRRLRVFMATLRKKLESAPDSPQYIQTTSASATA